ncbi:glycosyltransferase [Isoptericola sp. b441]|uniref:Glycosyltransferase n=1 Tax=Actinotalea lenta TaxID=3064654 RepID=A0ABT9DF04_9CELL|nr:MULTISPECIES: glycosyltransferase [unclassified Isoptericola]MDO8108416.1 glycosyltransferase [Isoptericola sp. b441]MDO8119834.1 glycosyltransferase [Isoptericola sp. b490]
MTVVAARRTASQTHAQDSTPAPVVLDLVIPVYNEVRGLEASVRRTREFLDAELGYPTRIVIADNASTDGTGELATRLAAEIAGVTAVHLDAKGRGRALRAAWQASEAPVLAYMDVDLSTDLAALLPLIAPLLSGHSHVSIGTRLARSSRVVRGPRRELISRAYNLLLHAALGVGFSDAQCGFKAVRSDVAHELLPLVADEEWFFDTELLVLAERAGLRIHEVPVDWVDDPDSRVDVVRTAAADLRGIARLTRDLARRRVPLDEVAARLSTRATVPQVGLVGQLLRFALVGGLSTVAYAILYLLLAGPIGPQPANLVALLLTAIGNTAANRRLTFGVRGSAGLARHHGQGLAVFLLGWALTAGALAWVHAAGTTSRAVELAVLVGANLLATGVRFVLLRQWVFRRGRARETVPAIGS